MKPAEKFTANLLLLLGMILRLRQYLSGRSLWADEAMLALNIVNRNISALFKPLDYDQGAPLGFLLVEKMFNLILGRNELVLRFFPLLAGMVSLWLFYLLLMALRGADGRINLLALAMFAVNPRLIYYTSEGKQYIVDVAVTLGLLVLAIPVFQDPSNRKNLLRLALAGILALWFSHPALFVLAGIGVALLMGQLKGKNRAAFRWLAGIGFFWLADFTVLYFLNLRLLSLNHYLASYWAEGFIPVPLWSNWSWFPAYFSELIQFQFEPGLLPVLVLTFIFIGWYGLLRENRSIALTVAFTSLSAFTASTLHLYPVSGRLSLFLIPQGILLLGKCFEYTRKSLESRPLLSTGAVLVLAGYLMINPLIDSTRNFISPKYYEHIRPTMKVLADSWKDGDSLFVTAWAEPAFRFYAPFYGLEGIEIASTEIADYPNGEKLKARLDPLIGRKRVWVLFSHVYETGGFNERDFLVAYLDQIGEKRREILKSGTSVYLYFYDLSK